MKDISQVSKKEFISEIIRLSAELDLKNEEIDNLKEALAGVTSDYSYLLYLLDNVSQKPFVRIDKIVIKPKQTIVQFEDGTRYFATYKEGDSLYPYSPITGVMICLLKKLFGGYLNHFLIGLEDIINAGGNEQVVILKEKQTKILKEAVKDAKKSKQAKPAKPKQQKAKSKKGDTDGTLS